MAFARVLFIYYYCCFFFFFLLVFILFGKIEMASIGDETSSVVNPTNALILPNILYPVIDQLDKSGYKDIQSDLRTTLFKLEEIYPGFSRNFLQLLINKEFPSLSSTTNLNELTLKIEKYCDKSSYYISSSRYEKEFQELNLRSKNLKRILSRIPDDINEKREFLETIKEIASAIKKTLDSVSNTYQYFKTNDGRQALENEKKEFIKYSKHFSNTLKAYFRDNKRDDVYIAANHLLIQTDYLLRTIKLYCEPDTIDEYSYPLLFQHQNQIKTNLSSRNQQQFNIRQSANIRPTSAYETNYS
jgi:programmed cell death protein 10